MQSSEDILVSDTKYVTAGIGEYTVKIPRPWFNIGTYILLLIIVIIGALAIIAVVYFLFRGQSLAPPSRPEIPPTMINLTTPLLGQGNQVVSPLTNFGLIPTNAPVGRSSDGTYPIPGCYTYQDEVSCTSSPRRAWINGSCTCLPPFWGGAGTRETYSEAYYGVGSPSLDDITYIPIQTQDVERLSFPSQGSCTGLCDQNQDCIGVIWDTSCTLLQDSVVVRGGAGLPYTPYTDASLYLKNGIRPRFLDRVFVFWGDPGLRYWLNERGLHNLTVMADRIYEIPLVNRETYFATTRGQQRSYVLPTGVINDGELVGVWSLNPININTLPNLIQEGTTENVVIQSPGTQLNFPPLWAHVPRLYVVYTKED